ncbi:MAG: hypothetical protein JWL82_286 [Parcubacteria group bacterium]|nr:hypothetical protein [Parcubacteria group bacterium]
MIGNKTAIVGLIAAIALSATASSIMTSMHVDQQKDDEKIQAVKEARSIGFIAAACGADKSCEGTIEVKNMALDGVQRFDGQTFRVMNRHIYAQDKTEPVGLPEYCTDSQFLCKFTQTESKPVVEAQTATPATN